MTDLEYAYEILGDRWVTKTTLMRDSLGLECTKYKFGEVPVTKKFLGVVSYNTTERKLIGKSIVELRLFRRPSKGGQSDVDLMIEGLRIRSLNIYEPDLQLVICNMNMINDTVSGEGLQKPIPIGTILGCNGKYSEVIRSDATSFTTKPVDATVFDISHERQAHSQHSPPICTVASQTDPQTTNQQESHAE